MKFSKHVLYFSLSEKNQKLAIFIIYLKIQLDVDFYFYSLDHLENSGKLIKAPFVRMLISLSSLYISDSHFHLLQNQSNLVQSILDSGKYIQIQDYGLLRWQNCKIHVNFKTFTPKPLSLVLFIFYRGIDMFLSTDEF